MHQTFHDVSSFEELAHIAADSGEWGTYLPPSICRIAALNIRAAAIFALMRRRSTKQLSSSAPQETWALPTVVTLAGVHRAVPVPVTAANANAPDTLHGSALSALPLAFRCQGQVGGCSRMPQPGRGSNLYSACQ